jgi:hypothetical protein
MIDSKLPKTAVVFESLAIRTAAQTARTKKDRDERRKAIKNQNARSRMK